MSITPDVLAAFRGANVLVASPFYFTPHLETGMEIAQVLSAENAVTYIGPDVLGCVTDETWRFTGRAQIKLSRKRWASRYVPDGPRLMSRSDVLAMSQKPAVDAVSSLIDDAGDDLAKLRVDGFDVGMAVRSSLVSLTRDTSASPVDHHDFAVAMARDAMWLHSLTETLIRAHRYDLVVLFNGRFAPVRAIRRACEASGTRYLAHELGSAIGKYALYDCAVPHQPAGYRSWVDAWWRFTGDPHRRAQGFLDRRRRGGATGWYSFTGKQVQGDVPPKSASRRVAFFTSSEDELAAIGDELRPDSPLCDQAVAIRSLGAACREKGYELVVRFHPNTSRSAGPLLDIAHEAARHVCPPDGSMDSYGLVDSSDIVFTHNSTMGIEAACAGKPVYYTGRNLFERCRSVTRLRSANDLAQALDRPVAQDRSDAVKYANFLAVHGIEHRLYEPRGFQSGRFRGRDLNAPLGRLRDLKMWLNRRRRR